MADSPARVVTLSADYSDDELDAIAELFERPRLFQRRAPVDRDEQIALAVRDTALRGLVARKALVLEGTQTRPRARFLEPHATLLSPYVWPDATISIRVADRLRDTVRAFFLCGNVVTVQSALPPGALKRMTAYSREETARLVLDGVEYASDDTGIDRKAIELTHRMWDAVERAISNGADPPKHAPAQAIDVMYARVSSVELEVAFRDAQGVVNRRRLAWLDAGTQGMWLIEPRPGETPVTVMLTPVEVRLLRERVTDVVSIAVEGYASTGQ